MSDISEQRLLLALKQARAKLEALQREKNESIAIIGMGCRFPGGANDPEAYWHLLREGIDAIAPIPPERWDIEAYYDPDPEIPGKMYVREGGFINDVDHFDAAFFGIAPREAACMDPQQRLLLEVSYAALEQAGQAPDSLKGSSTGVFMGVSFDDYSRLSLNSGDPAQIDAYSSLGNARSIAVGRIAYALGLQGPTMQLDTTCSSSLLAVHLAMQSLRSGECDLALAGGVNLMLAPEVSIGFCKLKAMSPDGRCKTFDASADGYGRGEGCGVVVLKRFSDAIANRDNILAVIRSSAVNHDGASNGLTAPNGSAQEVLLRQALKNGQVEPTDLQYLEVHGTGTSLGDPIEVLALNKVLGEGRSSDKPLMIGSVKTNFGHLEAAAGVASLIKVVLAQHYQQIPPHLHFHEPNPYIPWEKLPVTVPTVLTGWPNGNGNRLAGVSSFGMSGTNVHLIVENAPDREALSASQGEPNELKTSTSGNGTIQSVERRPLHLLTLSAKNAAALQELVESYQDFLGTQSETSIGDICFTANAGRSHFSYRRWVVAESLLELKENLVRLQEESAPVSLGKLSEVNQSQLAFLFTGQGSQYPEMGRELYQTQPTFRCWMDRCAEILAPHLDRPLLDILYASSSSDSRSPIDQTRYTQPALFALEYALYQLWRSWGIEPSVVMGHSVGEYVAACIAGVFSLEDGLTLIAARGRLMQALPNNGAMAAVMASEATVKTALTPYAETVTLAAINGPTNIVISGEQRSVEQVTTALEAKEIKVTRLNVFHGFHSPLMEPMLADFEQVARQVTFHAPQLAIIANVTGELVTEVIATPGYWCRHARQPVRFAAGMETLKQAGVEWLLELGPKPILLGMGRQCWPEDKGTWLPSLRPGQSDWRSLLNSLGELYGKGVSIDWSGFDRDYPRQRIPLPTYPFQRQRYWRDSKAYHQTQFSSINGAANSLLHPLLGRALSLADTEDIRFETQIRPESPAYLSDHCVYGAVILPATAYLEMALAAGKTIFKTDELVLTKVSIQTALILPADETTTLQVVLKSESSSTFAFKIFSFQPSPSNNGDSAWQLHASGQIQRSQSSQPEPIDLTAWQAKCSKILAIEDYYQEFRNRSIDYGSNFQAIAQLWQGDRRSLAQLCLPKALVLEAEQYQLHPVLLDNGLQTLAAACPEELKANTYLPVGLESLNVYPENLTHSSDLLWSHAEIRPSQDEAGQTLIADLGLFTQEGKVIATIGGLRVQQASPDAVLGTREKIWQDWLYEVAWEPKIRFSRSTVPADYLLAPTQIGDRLQPALTRQLTQPGLTSYQAAFEQLEILSVNYVLKAFADLGWQGQVGQTFDSNVIAQQLGIVSQHQSLLKRLLEMLGEVGVLAAHDSLWEVIQVPDLRNLQQLKQAFATQYPEAIAELTLIERCGETLGSVLQGKIDPLQLLFPEGDLSTTTQIYQHSPGAQLMNRLVQQAVGLVIEQLPPGQGARILEIGAGTGGTTAHLLPHLNPEQIEYVFTDVGAIFLTQAAQRFQDYPFVSYENLDIEKDPEAQGFRRHHYEVIVAANVLHATQDLRQTLQHIRQLLKPGGVLVLLEGIAKTRWLDLSFGLTDGWWRFNDFSLRADYPLISVDRWQRLLLEAGFQETVTLPGEPDGMFRQSVIVAQSSAIETPESLSQPKHWLILGDRQGMGRELAQHLRDRGDTCHLAFCDRRYEQLDPYEFTIDPLNPEDFQQLLEVVTIPDFPLEGVVHLWSLDTVTTQSLTGQALATASEQGCGSTLHLVQALTKISHSPSPTLWLVTQGSVAVNHSAEVPGVAQSALWGMGKVIIKEHPELNCVRVDLATESTANQAQALLSEICSEPPKEDQIALRDGKRYVARLVRSRQESADLTQSSLENLGNQPYQLTIPTRGTLENLQWQSMGRRSPQVGEVEICVQVTGLNFLDVLDVLGVLPFEREGLGGECVGTITAIGTGVDDLAVGETVMAIAPNSFSQYVTVPAALVVRKPDGLTLTEAATIPINFLTAHYALEHVAQLKAGERILIHAAAGGTGLAAVQIAQQVGAEVFATASLGKWDFLKSLGVNHVMNSRTLDFADEIMSITDGQGVDMVLNSLTSEDFIPKSLSVLTQDGRYLEIAKRDVLDTDKIAQLRPDVAYHFVDLRQLSLQQPELVGSMFGPLVQRFESGQLKPLPAKIFPLVQTVDAFRYMQQAKHIGKIVITHPTPSAGSAQPSTIHWRDDRSYLIAGGTGGLGLLVTRWLIKKGARHIILVNRRGSTPALAKRMAELEPLGAQVTIHKADVTEAEQVAQVLNEIKRSHPPLRGVIHGVGVLDDGVLQQQSWERFERVMAPKIQGAWHLHQLTQTLPLDVFILFSSAASLLGSLGQANHAAANAFLDALAHERRSQGLPALSINWGPVSQIGAAAKKQADEWVAGKGMGAISPVQVLAVLEQLWSTERSQVGVMPINWPQLSRQFPDWPFIANFQQTSELTATLETSFQQQLERMDAKEHKDYLTTHVCAQIAKVLGLNPLEPINPQQGFFELGMDSLTSVELRNRLQTSLDCHLPTTVTLDYPTVQTLVNYLAREVLALEEPFEPNNDTRELLEDNGRSPELAGLSQDELADLLSQKLATLD